MNPAQPSGVAPTDAGPPPRKPTPKPTPKRTPKFSSVLVVICIGLVGLDVALLLRHQTLKEQIARLTESHGNTPPPTLGAGVPFPRMTLFDQDGHHLSIRTDEIGRGTLLFISSDECGSCDALHPQWSDLAESATASGLEVLEIILDRTLDSAPHPSPRHPIATPGADSWALVEKLRGIPATLFIDSTGTVQRAFYGSPQPGLQQALLDFLTHPN